MFDEGYISRIYKELVQITDLKNAVNIGKGLTRYIPQEEVQVANKPMKKFSSSLVISKMQFETNKVSLYTP